MDGWIPWEIYKYKINKYIIKKILYSNILLSLLLSTPWQQRILCLSIPSAPSQKATCLHPATCGCHVWFSSQTMANLRVVSHTHCNFTNNRSFSPSTFCPQVLGSMLKEVLTFSHLAERATYQLILFVTHKAPKICDKISSVPLTRYIKYVIQFKYCTPITILVRKLCMA